MARTRGCLWLTAGVVVAVLAGVVAFVTLSRVGGQGPAGVPAAQAPIIQAVVAAQAVPVRSQLTAEMLALRDIPVTAAPAGYLTSVEDAAGQITLVDLYPDEVVLAQRLADPNQISGDGRQALVISEGEVLMAFPAEDLMSRIGVLKAGDRVDLLFSLGFPTDRSPGAQGAADEEQATFNLLQNKTIAAIVGGQATTGGTGGAPQAILFTVSPQDALVLKYVKDAGGRVDIVVRAPGDDGPVQSDPVDVDYLLNRYQIPNAVGR